MTLFLLAFASVCQAQQQPPLSPDELRRVLGALIDRDEALAKLKELGDIIVNVDGQVAILNERIAAEHAQRLDEKKLHLIALLALKEFRIVRRPFIIKFFTAWIVHDKHDKELEALIKVLEKEIAEWR